MERRIRSALAAVLAGATLVHSHGHVQNIVVDGKLPSGYRGVI
jgi:hypothetical protein